MTGYRTVETALEPYQADIDGPFGTSEAGHLLRRTSFGGSLTERRRIESLGPKEGSISLTETPPPSGDFAATLRVLTALSGLEDPEVSRSVWLTRMIRDPHPFREMLALFWHGHFATSVTKVGRISLLESQVDLFRQLGPGSLKDLLQAISRDPAMILWLDGNANRRFHPNENYARELMELFTLGESHYTERDVLEAARAFTGWHEFGGRFRFVAGEHDEGTKEILGRSGNLNGDDVLEACLDQPAAGQWVASRLFRFFVHEEPTPSMIEVLGARYAESGYDTLALLRLLFESREFYGPKARRGLVKSPIALAAGTIRSLDIRLDTRALSIVLDRLGQSLYAPPSVKGWDGGDSWINAATLIGRINLAADLLDPDGAFGSQVNESALTSENRPIADVLIDLLLDNEVPSSVRFDLARAGGTPREIAHVLMSIPEYQLA
ncbi:MAG: DUF1800 domain-containing protein [Planctomycetota bacterium]|nr:DUF1800 domain-containing protein [Planctomycetota bacterium]